MKKVIKLTIKPSKPRALEHFEMQRRGILRTQVVANKKKKIKNFNWKQDSVDYLSINNIVF